MAAGSKLRALVEGIPREGNPGALLAGMLPGIPFVRRGQATTLGDVLWNAAQLKHFVVADADYQCLPDDRKVGMRPLTAPRTIYLPDVGHFPLGEELFIADYTGLCSDALSITIRPGPGTEDVIGVPDGTAQLTSPNQGIGFRRGDQNLWIRASA